MKLCADIKRLREDTGWKPVVNFEEGIKLFIDEVKAKQEKNERADKSGFELIDGNWKNAK